MNYQTKLYFESRFGDISSNGKNLSLSSAGSVTLSTISNSIVLVLNTRCDNSYCNDVLARQY